MEECIYGPLLEEWRPIAGYEGIYSVSNYGLIRSEERIIFRNNMNVRLRQTVLKQLVTINGYAYISLYKDYERYKPMSHKIVSKAFLDPIPNKTHVNHKNGIRNDNFIWNLEMVNARENITFGFKYGGKRKPKSSQFVGVRWVESRNKWRATIFHNKKLVNLGSYANEGDAGQAYKDALVLYGYQNRYA